MAPEYFDSEILWRHLKTGVLMLDTAKRQVVRTTESGRALLEQLGVPLEYGALAGVFLSDGESAETSDLMAQAGRVLKFSVQTLSSERVCVLFDDVTETRRLEAIAETANLMENVGYVFTGIRHELGNPINSIKTAVTVLQRERHWLPDATVERLIQQTLTNVGRVEYLLRALKGFNLFDEVHTEPIELTEFFGVFFGLAERDLSARGVESRMTTDPEGPLWAAGDPRALQHVVLNLLTNSLDALDGVTRPRIEVRASNQGDVVEIEFTDNGAGIPVERQGDLFKPFHTSKVRGSGLGLFITKRMITSMNGQIAIESQPNQGTSVILTLPRADGSKRGRVQ